MLRQGTIRVADVLRLADIGLLHIVTLSAQIAPRETRDMSLNMTWPGHPTEIPHIHFIECSCYKKDRHAFTATIEQCGVQMLPSNLDMRWQAAPDPFSGP
jgi:hypothetical protein